MTNETVHKKNIALLASTKDTASMNVYAQLCAQWKKSSLVFEASPVYVHEFPHYRAYLFLTHERSVYCEHIDTQIENTVKSQIDALIFITKHDSKSGRPSFSVHTQGNWDKNELGGNAQEIATCPVILKHVLYLELLKQNNLDGFEVVNECTHHGPSIAVPSIFIEIGSTVNEWDRKDAGAIITSVLIAGLTIYNGESDPLFLDKPVIIGFGGTHTCSNFARLISENKALLSHVCPSYAIDTLTDKLITQAIHKTTTATHMLQNITLIIDWKGLSSSQRVHMSALLETVKLPYQRLATLKEELDSPQTTAE